MKPAFKFTWHRPVSDWFDVVNVSIEWTDYNYFRLERRFGPSWWLIGKKYIDETNKWNETQIAQMFDGDVKRFMKWARNDYNRGSKLSEVRAISCDFDVCGEIVGLSE